MRTSHRPQATVQADAASVQAGAAHRRAIPDEAGWLRSILEQAPGLLAVVTGPDHVIELANRELTDVARQGDLAGRRAVEAVPAGAQQGVVRGLEKVYRSGEPFTARSVRTRLQRSAEGPVETVYFDVAYQPLRRADGAIWGVLVQACDVTEQRRARDVLREGKRELSTALEAVDAREGLQQAHRMEALGKLTGGIAHDFNNLLTVVIGNAETLTEALEDRPDLQALAQLALAAGESGAQLTSHLLAFSRQQPLTPHPLRPLDVITELAPLLRRTLGEDIDLRLRPLPEQKFCLVDRVRLESALLNLCLNARDAMPDGGRLTIESGAATATLSGASGPAEYVKVAVTDTGVGMDERVRRQAFDPYFTTKTAANASGLGLSMIYGFVRQSGGEISVRSEVGRGTTFEIYFPVVEAEPQAAASARPSPAPGGAGHVLVVEDDAAVRGLVVRQLKSLGYRVTDRADARAALDALGQDESIGLLFTDVVMPGGMNGRQLVDQARLLRPDLRVLFTSGYTNDAVLLAGALGAQAQLLGKPYKIGDLASAVQTALQTQDAAAAR
jgi:signal transduction histidine kinase/CheY-like chemotaxis protein